MNKLKYIFVLLFLFSLTACSSKNYKETSKESKEDDVSLTIDNKSKEKETDKEKWPEETGTLSEEKNGDSYIYEGYNFDFGKDLPKKNYIKMIRKVEVDTSQVEIKFPEDENNIKEIDLKFTYDPRTKEIIDLVSNKEDIDMKSISKKLSMIHNMINSN